MIIPQYVFNRDRHQKQLSIMIICKNKVFFKSWKRLSFLSNYEGIKPIKDYWNKRNHIFFEFVLQEQKNICAKYLYFNCIFFINQPVSRQQQTQAVPEYAIQQSLLFHKIKIHFLNSSSSLTKVKHPTLPTTHTASFYC